jgi:hypothetical protein
VKHKEIIITAVVVYVLVSFVPQLSLMTFLGKKPGGAKG